MLRYPSKIENLEDYRDELEDIFLSLNGVKERSKHLNSVKLDKHLEIMQETLFRVDHQINKKPLVTNSLYVESNDTLNHCMDCVLCVRKHCSFRDHRVDRQYGSCPEFEEKCTL